MTVSLEPVRRPSASDRPLPDLLDAASEADAASLFRDDPRPARTSAPGDARRQPRLCPDCGTHVPAGMSLCGTCGLDLDTGLCSDTLDVVEPVAEATHERPPIAATALLVGWGAVFYGTLLCVLGLLSQSLAGIPELLAGLFVGYTAVLFLVGRAGRPLVFGLMLAGLVTLCMLVIAPILVANGTISGPQPTPTQAEQAAEPSDVRRHLDMNTLVAGVALVTTSAFMMIYLSTQSSRRHIGR